jgi:hypothetical protein
MGVIDHNSRDVALPSIGRGPSRRGWSLSDKAFHSRNRLGSLSSSRRDAPRYL